MVDSFKGDLGKVKKYSRGIGDSYENKSWIGEGETKQVIREKAWVLFFL